MKERRDNTRLDLSGAITFETCSSRDPELNEDRQQCRGVAVNVSGTGVCLETFDDIKETQILKLNIPLPGMSIHIPTLAMVMWKEPIEGGSRVGTMFVI